MGDVPRVKWRIKAKFPGEGDELFHGTVEGVYLEDGGEVRLKVAYDDGDVEERLPLDWVGEVVTRHDRPQVYGVGEAVECLWGQEADQYYPGIIAKAELVGSTVMYHVRFEDGDEREEVPCADIRPREEETAMVPADDKGVEGENNISRVEPQQDQDEALFHTAEAPACEERAGDDGEEGEEGEEEEEEEKRGAQSGEEEGGIEWKTASQEEDPQQSLEGPQHAVAEVAEPDLQASAPAVGQEAFKVEEDAARSGELPTKEGDSRLDGTSTGAEVHTSVSQYVSHKSEQEDVTPAAPPAVQAEVEAPAAPSAPKAVSAVTAPAELEDTGAGGSTTSMQQENTAAPTMATPVPTPDVQDVAGREHHTAGPTPSRQQKSHDDGPTDDLPPCGNSWWAYIHQFHHVFGDGSEVKQLPDSTYVLPEDRLAYIQLLTARAKHARMEEEARGDGLEAQLLTSQGPPVGFFEQQRALVSPLTVADRRLIDLHIRTLALTRLCCGTQSHQSVRALCDLADLYANFRLWPQAESAIGRAQYLHLQLARKAAAEEALEGLGEGPQLRAWEVSGLRSPARRASEPPTTPAGAKADHQLHNDGEEQNKWKYKDVDVTPVSAACAVLSVMATLRAMASSSSPAGYVDVPSFISRLRGGKDRQHPQHLSQAYAERFARELEKALGGDRVKFQSAQRKQRWQVRYTNKTVSSTQEKLLGILRSTHRLFQHSVRAAHYAIDMQDVAILRLIFEGVELQRRAVVDALDLVCVLQNHPLALQFFPQDLGLLDAIASYSMASATINTAAANTHKQEADRQKQPPKVELKLPLCWEETLALLVTRPRPVPLMTLRCRLLTLKGRVAVQAGHLTPAREALGKALEEVEMRSQVASMTSVPVYNAIVDYWIARAALTAAAAATQQQQPQGQPPQTSPKRVKDQTPQGAASGAGAITSGGGAAGVEPSHCLDKATEYMTKAVEIMAAAYDWTHPEVAHAMVRLAGILLRKDDKDEASMWLVRALEIFETYYRGSHSNQGDAPAVAVISILLGRGLLHHPVLSQRLSGAELIAKALEAQMARLHTLKAVAGGDGDEDKDLQRRKKALAVYVFRTSQLLAGHWQEMQEQNKCVRALKLSIKAGKEAFGRDSIRLVEVFKRLGLVYETNRQNLDSAFSCYRRMREICLRQLGHMDARTREAMSLLRRTMTKREALGLSRVPSEWDFLLYHREEDGGLRRQGKAGRQKNEDEDDEEWWPRQDDQQHVDQQPHASGGKTVLKEFAIQEQPEHAREPAVATSE